MTHILLTRGNIGHNMVIYSIFFNCEEGCCWFEHVFFCMCGKDLLLATRGVRRRA